MVEVGRFLGRPSKKKQKKRSLQQESKNIDRSLYGIPVEEVDPFIFENTFCVIGKKYGRHYIYRFSGSRSLFIFGPLNPVRKFACRIITNQLCDFFIILVIACNCITLAFGTNYEDRKTGKMVANMEIEKVIEYLEYFFLGMYTLEMTLKIIARGFVINKYAYLRSLWNILDFTVVFTSLMSTVLMNTLSYEKEYSSFEFLRSLRVLRAIKTISLVPGLRIMINALLSSVVQLLEVMALTLFCLLMFSLLALQLFMGKLLQKCVLVKNGIRHLQMIYEERSRSEDELGSISPNDPDRNLFWYKWVQNEHNWLRRKYSYPKNEYQPCGNDSWSRQCPEGYACLKDVGENFDNGWTSFDSFFRAMFTTFQLITLDFWERVYELVLSHTSPWSVIFFIIVIFLGSFYLLNLMLAVVAMSYEQEYQNTVQFPLSKSQKLSSKRTASTFSFDNPGALNLKIMTDLHKRTLSEREFIMRGLRDSLGMPKQDQFQPDGVRKKPDLQKAVMTMIGRRRSVESVLEADTRAAQASVSIQSAKPSEAVPVVPQPTITIGAPALDEIISSSTRMKSISMDELSKASVVSRSREESSTVQSKCAWWFRFLLLLRASFTPVVTHEAFEMTITIIIILNTLLLACDHHGQPKWLSSFMDGANHFFTAVFLLEAILKICALQRGYFRTIWNLFDLFLVAISLVDLVLQSYRLNLMRIMRLLRIFKLAQSWITMKVLLHIIVSTFAALGYLSLVLLIVLYIFSILGMQIIGKYYTRKAFHAENHEELFPRWNFQNFVYAFMMVFRVICGEWIEPMWECFLATSYYDDEYKCFFIFLPILVIGNFIVLNLFLALLLNSFDTDELNAKREKELESSGKSVDLKKIVAMLMAKRVQTESHFKYADSTSSGLNSSVSIVSSRLAPPPPSTTPSQVTSRFRKAVTRVIKIRRKTAVEEMLGRAADQKYSQLIRVESRLAGDSATSVDAGTTMVGFRGSGTKILTPLPCVPKKCWAMNCRVLKHLRGMSWDVWDSQRLCATRIVNHPVFEWFILALIFASSITLCFEDVYLDERQDLKETLFYINAVFTCIFVMEMVFKWFALGIWSYFTNFWTILDAFIVAVSVVSLAFEALNRSSGVAKGPTSNFAALKALRTLRALRPLRAISRWQGMRIIVNALMTAIPSIMNVLLVCLVFWLIFAIVGVHTFKGKFYRCVDSRSGEIISASKVRTRFECCNNTDKYSWINQEPNFDNVPMAYLTLFQVATFEGWLEAIKASVDSTEIDEQPRRDNYWPYFIFFVLFIVFGSFFTLNLFIGVIIDNFNKLKKQYEGHLLEALLTPSQRRYYTTLKKIQRKKPRKVIRRPTNEVIALCYDVSMSRNFEIAIFVLIFCNMVLMGFEHYRQREMLTHVLGGFNSFFTTMYSLEAIVKIVGLRHYYFTVPWNLFDFLLVMASVFELAVGDLIGEAFPIPPIMLRIVRVVRIGRVLRLIEAAKGIRKLLFALIVSLPALFNIGMLLALVTFIYAILGMALFGRIAKNSAIDDAYNFETFLRSCLMLLRLMTAAGWNDVLNAMNPVEPVCGSYRKIACGRPGEGECANVGFAIMYMVSYLFISFLIVINMYIAIILENFYLASKEVDIGLVEEDLEMFYQRWARYDPQATQFIRFDQLSDFLDILDPPVGIRKPNTLAIVSFNLPIARGNKIHCLDILHALVKSYLGEIEDSKDFRKLQDQMDLKFRKLFPTRRLLDIVSTTRQWKIEHNAAVTIQRAWREYRKQKYPLDYMSTHELQRRGTTISMLFKDEHGFLSKMGHLFGVRRSRRRSSIERSEPPPMESTDTLLRVSFPDKFPRKSDIGGTNYTKVLVLASVLSDPKSISGMPIMKQRFGSAGSTETVVSSHHDHGGNSEVTGMDSRRVSSEHAAD